MEAERWRQIEQLGDAALEQDAGGRAAFLEQACAGNESLRQEVESLLAQQEKSDSFLEAPAVLNRKRKGPTLRKALTVML